MIHCSNCGHELSPLTDVCPFCNEDPRKVIDPKAKDDSFWRCECGQLNDKADNFCQQCKQKKPEQTFPSKPQSTLINCPACGNQVSREAFSCPKCGHPIKQQEKVFQPTQTYQPPTNSDEGSYGGGWALGLLLGIIGLIIALVGSKSETKRGALHGFILQAIIGIIWACSSLS